MMWRLISAVLAAVMWSFAAAAATDPLADPAARLKELNELRKSDLPSLEARAGKGDSRAMALLGEAWELGFAGLPIDNAKAAFWLSRAAASGQAWARPEASFLRFETEHAGEIASARAALDRARAALSSPPGSPPAAPDKTLADLAKRGLADAQLLLARQYDSGRGAPRDAAAAVRWYYAAAKGGSAAADHRLASMLAEGRGVARSPALALRYETAAAEGGDTDAQLALARMFIQGGGPVAADPVEAMTWLAIASRSGSMEAREAFTKLSAALGARDTQEALIRAGERVRGAGLRDDGHG